MSFYRHYLIWVFLLLPAPVLLATDTTPQKKSVKVTFHDGRIEIGQIVRRAGNLTILETPLKKIWCHRDSIKETEVLEAGDPPVIYRRLPKGNNSRKRLGYVVADLKWESPRNPDDSISFTCHDEKLGEIKDDLVTRTFSATICYQDGKKYHWPRAFDNGLIWKFFRELPPPQTFQEKLDRVRFLRQGQRFAEAKTLLSSFDASSEEEKKLYFLESSRLEGAQDLIQSLFDKRKQGFTPRFLPEKPKGIPENIFESFKKWWLRGASQLEIPYLLKTVEDSDFDSQKIPSLMQSLPSPPPEISLGQPHVIDWNWEGESRHYSVYLPQNYSVDRLYSCFVTLHGQGGNDENMVRMYQKYANLFDLIVLSPEYIYDRRWGYEYSRKDIQAVVGAVRDARWKFAIDPQRVFLLGLSQGAHANFDITQSFVNEFAASSPMIGWNYYLSAQNAHLKNYPLYIVNGEFDADHPKACRKTIKQLIRWDSPSVYVEYKNRGHELFDEEFDNLWLFLASHQRQPWTKEVESYWARNGEGARQWLRLIPQTIQTERIRAVSKKSLLNLSGKWKKNTLTIKADKRLKEFEILIPENYQPLNKPLKVKVNRKTVFNEEISGWNLEDYLREISRNKDRWTPIRQVLKISLP